MSPDLQTMSQHVLRCRYFPWSFRINTRCVEFFSVTWCAANGMPRSPRLNALNVRCWRRSRGYRITGLPTDRKFQKLKFIKSSRVKIRWRFGEDGTRTPSLSVPFGSLCSIVHHWSWSFTVRNVKNLHHSLFEYVVFNLNHLVGISSMLGHTADPRGAWEAKARNRLSEKFHSANPKRSQNEGNH